MAGVTYATFFNSALRLVRVSKTVGEFSIKITILSDSCFRTHSLGNCNPELKIAFADSPITEKIRSNFLPHVPADTHSQVVLSSPL